MRPSANTRPSRVTPPSPRVASVDAYRGLILLLMLAEVLRTCAVSAAVPGSRLWTLVCYEQSHAAWVGASLHDLIQPSFYFLVGVGLLLSMNRRVSQGQSAWAMTLRALVRSVALIVLGMVLVAVHPRRWTWSFVDTLTQIGLAYPFLFYVALRPKNYWYIALGTILSTYWIWFALFPLPPENFDYASVGVSTDWLRDHGLTGFAAHWHKNSNAAWAFDRWFLNLFPNEAPYAGSANGLTTLNFIPSIGTMILGLIAGDAIGRDRYSPWHKARWLLTVGLLLVLSGWTLGASGVSPVVKAIWTPSWVLFSGGWCFLILAAFYWLELVNGLTFRRLMFPLTVVGMNSLVAYSLSHLYPALSFNLLRRAFGDSLFFVLGIPYEPLLYGAAVLLMYWLVLYALYRRKIFVRV